MLLPAELSLFNTYPHSSYIKQIAASFLFHLLAVTKKINRDYLSVLGKIRIPFPPFLHVALHIFVAGFFEV